jgi:hypothetical protein
MATIGKTVSVEKPRMISSAPLGNDLSTSFRPALSLFLFFGNSYTVVALSSFFLFH